MKNQKDLWKLKNFCLIVTRYTQEYRMKQYIEDIESTTRNQFWMEFQVHTVTREDSNKYLIFGQIFHYYFLMKFLFAMLCLPMQILTFIIERDEIIKARNDVIKNIHLLSNNQRKCSTNHLLYILFNLLSLSLFPLNYCKILTSGNTMKFIILLDF